MRSKVWTQKRKKQMCGLDLTTLAMGTGGLLFLGACIMSLLAISMCTSSAEKEERQHFTLAAEVFNWLALMASGVLISGALLRLRIPPPGSSAQ